MTDDELQKLCDAATPGPWEWRDDGDLYSTAKKTWQDQIICTDSCVYPPRGNPESLREAQEYAAKHPEDDSAGKYARKGLEETVAEPPDAAFIAASREAVPRLLAENKQLREALDESDKSVGMGMDWVRELNPKAVTSAIWDCFVVARAKTRAILQSPRRQP